MKVYPQVPFTPGLRSRVELIHNLSVSQLLPERRLEAEGMYYPPVGIPVLRPELEALQERLEQVARRAGYPGDTPSRGSDAFRQVDFEWGVALDEQLDVSPHQAFNSEMWNFITTALVPDLVKWRWGKSGGALERWVGPGHGGRNCFGRLWRRAWTLKVDGPDPYWLSRELVEDEFIQIFERTALAGCRPLAREVARVHIRSLDQLQGPRTERMRDLARRILRMGAFIEVDALDPAGMTRFVEACVMDLFGQGSGVAG